MSRHDLYVLDGFVVADSAPIEYADSLEEEDEESEVALEEMESEEEEEEDAHRPFAFMGSDDDETPAATDPLDFLTTCQARGLFRLTPSTSPTRRPPTPGTSPARHPSPSRFVDRADPPTQVKPTVIKSSATNQSGNLHNS